MAGLKLTLARYANRAERFVERFFFKPVTVAKAIEPYIGYTTPEHFVLRGRVLGKVREDVITDGQGRLKNLRQMLRLFLTDEVADITVHHGDYSAVSDTEGYFTLLVPRDGITGMTEFVVRGDGFDAVCRVAETSRDATFGVISDVDDTMMKTGAYSLFKNIWTSLTSNSLTREVFPDAVELMEKLHEGGRNPVYFVSSSPWNFYRFLRSVFDRFGLPEAPMFLRDYGISETQFITGTHGDHKGRAIDVLMAANPDLPYVLIGDTGQHDAHVYAEAALRHEGRIARVILRAPGKGADDADMREVGRLRDLGIPVHVGVDYSEALASV